MAAKIFGITMPHLSAPFGPALMISMGYINLGKWVVTVDGGARFGYDIGLLVIIFNLTAIMCQYLAACIGTVSGKNLAEICSEEYCKPVCILLGVQAELSMISSELTTVLGMAYGFSLMFGMDLLACILCITVGTVLLLVLMTLLDNYKTEALYIGMAGFGLLFYVFGVLISQSEVPLMMSWTFPTLSGENVYSLMALLGASIMSHNFYIHSSLVQEQGRSPNNSIGSLFHDHFFAILLIFTGIFLVNYVLMNASAMVFSSADVFVLNFEDVSLLMDQIFKNPLAPIILSLVLLLSSQITTFTWNIGGQVVLRSFFGINLTAWVHHVIFKVFSIIPALYCVKSAGTEGMYELLVFCQVILAILLPSAAIPLFRVASSRFIMGSFKIPWYVEILALLAFLGMLAANVVFSVEMLFGNSSWIMNLRGGMGSSVMVPYAFLLLITWTSLGLTLYLAVTPLKSASVRSDTQTWTCNSLKDEDKLFVGRQDDDQDLIKNEGYQKYSLETALDMQSDKSILELNIKTSEAAIECNDDDSFQHSACGVTEPSSCNSPAYQSQKSLSEPEVDFTESMDTVSVGTLSDNGILQRVEDKVQGVEDNVQRVEDNVQRDELRDLDEKSVGVEVIVPTFQDNKEVDALEREEFPGEALPASISTGPEFANNIVDKGFDEGTVSGSLSKLSGLGRAARRQLTAILDEFWGNLFDFHGKLTQEANTKRLDALLGLDSKAIGSSVKSDTIGFEATKSFYPADTERGSVLPAISRDYNSPNLKNFSDVEFSLGVQRGSPSWSQGMQSNRHLQSSSSSLLDPSERAYSSLRLPLHSESHDYQPATIHGYQMASYLKGMSASRNPYSDISQNMSREPKSVGTFLPNIRDQVTYTRGQNELGSSGTSGWPSQDISRINRLQAELPCYDPSLIEMGENAGSSSYTKKYHSSPDISALIAAGRNQYLNEAAWGGPIGPRQSSGRMTYEQSQYLNTVSGVSGLNNVARTGVPLGFDELSPPKIHQNVYSRASSMNMDARSLWSTQPFEQFYGMKGNDKNERVGGVTLGPSIAAKHTIYAESEAKLLKSLRFCIMKLLKLEGSDWLFRQNGGFDEELIDRVAGAEKHQHDVDVREKNQELQHLPTDQKFSSIQSSADADVMPFPSLRNCGDNCIWRASLVVSFGVWCIQRTLEMALVESRPELWGKYTYVLNRLQGIIEPAFLKPRQHVGPCSCLEILGKDEKNLSPSLQSGALVATEKPSKNVTTAGMVLEVIKEVEAAVSGRKGRTGTAAGDVAFPKGKENLASVLKRYKRRLLNKPPGTHEGTSSSRKIRTPPPTVL